MTTRISAYEASPYRYKRLINVMMGYDASTQPRHQAEAQLVSLHEHKGALQIVTRDLLTPLGKELLGVLWEIQGEDRASITFEVAD